jgi:hypothetical protein
MERLIDDPIRESGKYRAPPGVQRVRPVPDRGGTSPATLIRPDEARRGRSQCSRTRRYQPPGPTASGR